MKKECSKNPLAVMLNYKFRNQKLIRHICNYMWLKLEIVEIDTIQWAMLHERLPNTNISRELKKSRTIGLRVPQR